MFEKVLIANRGEIAVRIIRACRELGVKTCVVFSEEDRESLAVKMADEAICIGKPHPRESYLQVHRILAAAEISGSDAIHPGYGFLSENADFVEACQEMKIVLIGPPPEFIRLMGDKLQAKKKMAEIGIPVIEGTDVLKDEEEARAKAKEIGYPVIIKACAGGGGKGTKIVREEKEIAAAFSKAAAEANSAFNDSRVYMEKLLTSARHIEIQILVDNYGSFLIFPERNCTIQKSFQKVIEESPSPGIDKRKRRQLQEWAKLFIEKSGYKNAATIEFLEAGDDFFFMEANTRIQVEHPVSEEVSGIDIVKEQIKCAAGEKIDSAIIEPQGWSIEARITGITPGKIRSLFLPAGPFVRVDSHIYEGYNFTVLYDQLLMKLITRGHDRETARQRLVRSLTEFKIDGIKTNKEDLLLILESEEFKGGEYKLAYNLAPES